MSRNEVLQNDYVRFPPSKRARAPELAALWIRHADQGLYHLNEAEQFWADLQPYLLERGYRLRPRYTPGFEPIWIYTDINPRCFEESVPLPLPNGVFIVTPWLAGFDYVRLERVGEVVELLKQLLECLSFMHRHGVAHRDCTGLNIMQDTRACFYGKRTHPIEACYSEDIQTMYDRDPEVVPTFYFIDFGVSSRHEGPGPHLVTGVICRDKTAPELSSTVPYDPFKLDIYLLGNHVLQKYLGRYCNIEFLRPVLLAMTNVDPALRPTSEESLDLLQGVLQHVVGVQLRWRLRERDETLLNVVFDDGGHLLREVGSQLRSIFS
ncbi:hypothetical protein AURDEDRAFT_162263 [Auricularia subglabra TFB-10046 SS5]|nr:hypothetical protein AURDEDRAFT_162263 [Auricularia subglabra TFB-10046 SS5]